MRLLILMATIGAIACTNLSSIRQECPEQSISDLSQTCISPEYIEGCTRYKNSQECFECTEGRQLFIQNISLVVVDVIFLLVLPLKIISLAAFKFLPMENVVIAQMAILDKKVIVNLVLNIARLTTVMVDASVASHNSPSCLMNAGTIICQDAKQKRKEALAQNVLNPLNSGIKNVSSLIVKHTMILDVQPVNVDSISRKVDLA